MSFLNPLLLLALAGVGVPLLAHLIGRRRGRPQPFAALQFLLSSEKRLRTRRRLRNVFLLLLRVLLVMAAALTVARPILRADGAIVSDPVSAVAVVDRSLSMRARDARGEQLFAIAQARLLEALDRLPPGSDIAVLEVEERLKSLTPGFVGVPAARRVVQQLAPGYGRADGAAALREAATLLATASHGSRLVLVASDLQANAWDSAVVAPGLTLTSLLKARPAANVGLVGTRAEASGEDRELHVDLVRWPAATAGDQAVAVTWSDALIARDLIRFDADQQAAHARLSLDVELGEDPILTTELIGADSLAADNVHFAFSSAPASVRVLALNGSPATTLQADELYYLTAALRARGELQPDLIVDVVDASVPHWPGFEAHDVVVLANVDELPASRLAELEEFVAAGGGLVLAVGERVTAARWNQALGPLLPAVLESAEPGPGETSLVAPDPQHPVVDGIVQVASRLRLDRLTRLKPVPGANTLLELPGGQPVLVERAHGAGRVAILATTLDRDWTDLAVRPLYLPLMERLLTRLQARSKPSFVRHYRVGDSVSFPAATGSELIVTQPDGRVQRVAAGVGRFEAQIPGIHRALAAGAGRFDFVVNADPLESDLKARDEPLMSGDGTDATRESRRVQLLAGTDLSLPLSWLVLGLFVIETFVARYG